MSGVHYGGFPLANLDDDYNNGVIKPFNESPVLRIETFNVINTGSIDTSSFDSYRQGIELTSDKFYQSGLVKIHSGETNHKLLQTQFGYGKYNTEYSRKKTFQELDYFDPIEYLKAQESITSISELITRLTYPIISPDVDESENYNLDGIIEPLTIRAKASFFSIDSPFEAHDVRGEYETGNKDSTWSVDLIVSKYIKDDNSKTAFLDMIDIQNGKPTTGYFIWEKSPLKPFSDDKMSTKSIIISPESEHLRSFLQVLNPDSETYIPYDQVSTTNGFIYDTISGTDSIIYGDLIQNIGINPYSL